MIDQMVLETGEAPGGFGPGPERSAFWASLVVEEDERWISHTTLTDVAGDPAMYWIRAVVRTPEGTWRRADSNRRPPACKAGALPAELRPRRSIIGSVLERPAERAHGVGVGDALGLGVGVGLTSGSSCSTIPSSGTRSKHVRVHAGPVKLVSTDQK